MQPSRGRAHQQRQVAVAEHVEQFGVSGALRSQSGLAGRPDACSRLACRASRCCKVICLQATRVAADTTEITASSVMALPLRIPRAVSSRQAANSTARWQAPGASG